MSLYYSFCAYILHKYLLDIHKCGLVYMYTCKCMSEVHAGLLSGRGPGFNAYLGARACPLRNCTALECILVIFAAFVNAYTLCRCSMIPVTLVGALSASLPLCICTLLFLSVQISSGQ